MKKQLLIAALIAVSANVNAEKGHIADDVFVFIHGGPSNQYRITGRVRSGSPITIIKKSTDGKFVQIRTKGGKVGWADANNVESGNSMQVRMPKLEKSLQESRELVQKQADEIVELQQSLTTYRDENGTYTSKVDKLEKEINRLNKEIDNMDESNLMRWFTHGGLVALGGVILGLILPHIPKKKKRSDDWF